MPKRTFTLTIPAAARTPALTLTGAGGGSGDVLFKSFPASKPTIELKQTRSRLTLRRTLITKLADQFRDKGEFRRGETYLFFKDLDGSEVEIAFELPTPVYSRLTKITCLSYKALSYSRFSKIKLDNYFWTS